MRSSDEEDQGGFDGSFVPFIAQSFQQLSFQRVDKFISWIHFLGGGSFRNSVSSENWKVTLEMVELNFGDLFDSSS